MIDLYAAPTTNGLRARIMLEECGLDYTLHKVNMRAREHKTPEFLAINPMGMTPVLIDHDGPGGVPITIAQSVAILFYLGEKSGKLIPLDPAARAAFWMPMMNAATDIGPTYGALSFIIRADPVDEATKARFVGRLGDFYGVWDSMLENSTNCAGKDFTIADIALFGIYARSVDMYPQALEGMSNLARWAAATGARPAVQKGLDFG